MPGRAVGEGAGVSLGLAGEGVLDGGTGVGEASRPEMASRAAGVWLATGLEVGGTGVLVTKRNGKVQVGTAVRAGVGAGCGLQADNMSKLANNHKTVW